MQGYDRVHTMRTWARVSLTCVYVRTYLYASIRTSRARVIVCTATCVYTYIYMYMHVHDDIVIVGSGMQVSLDSLVMEAPCHIAGRCN